MRPVLKKVSSLLLLGALAFSGCDQALSKTETDKAPIPQTRINTEPMELVWKDLMPVGEEERLAEMYTEYYEELESRMVGNATQLKDAANTDAQTDEGFDPSNIAEGSANDTMDQIGTFNVVSSLDGLNIRIPGYVVPLDFNAENKYKEFLLVPYFGACLHTPPPPPNQIIFVNADPAVKVSNIEEPFWIEGIMTTGEFSSDLASTAYEVKLSTLSAYDY